MQTQGAPTLLRDSHVLKASQQQQQQQPMKCSWADFTDQYHAANDFVLG